MTEVTSTPPPDFASAFFDLALSYQKLLRQLEHNARTRKLADEGTATLERIHVRLGYPTRESFAEALWVYLEGEHDRWQRTQELPKPPSQT